MNLYFLLGSTALNGGDTFFLNRVANMTLKSLLSPLSMQWGGGLGAGIMVKTDLHRLVWCYLTPIPTTQVGLHDCNKIAIFAIAEIAAIYAKSPSITRRIWQTWRRQTLFPESPNLPNVRVMLTTFMT